MDPETQRWAWGIAITAMLALIGALYAWIRYDQRRQAKNLHDLRSVVDRQGHWITVIREKLGIGPRNE